MEPIKPGTKKLARTSIRAVRELFTVIDNSGVSYTQVAKQTGVHINTLSYWKSGRRSPSLVEFQSVAETLGYDVVLREAPPLTSR